jgi:hypothetical protein
MAMTNQIAAPHVSHPPPTIFRPTSLATVSHTMDKFDEIIATTEKLLITWARPEGWIESPLASWPLTQFDLAVKIALGYLAFVLIGSVCSLSLQQFFPHSILFPLL